MLMLTYADVCDANAAEEDAEPLSRGELDEAGARAHFTCFTGTKVQILTQAAAWRRRGTSLSAHKLIGVQAYRLYKLIGS
jgi:hypothetical protein